MRHIGIGAVIGLALVVFACGAEQPAAEVAAEEPTSGTVAVPGAELAYTVDGDGIPTLVVGSSIYYPRTFSEELRKHLKLAFVDLRHFAPSDGSLPAQEFTLDRYAADIDAVREHLGFETVIVMGHSMHGMFALEYARRYPDRVTHAIMIGSPPAGLMATGEASAAFFEADASDERKQTLRKSIEAYGAEEYAQLAAFEDGDAVIDQYVVNGAMYWFDATYDAAPLWRDMYINMESFFLVMGQIGLYDLAQGPGEVTAPVLAALGRYDYVVPYTMWDGAEEKLADLTIHVFDKSGHTPQLEEPAEFDRVLLEWLRKH
jgi:proline iminopeptidase